MAHISKSKYLIIVRSTRVRNFRALAQNKFLKLQSGATSHIRTVQNYRPSDLRSIMKHLTNL